MGSLLVELEANYSGRVQALDATIGCSVLGDGSSLGHPVERPMYSQTFDGERVTVTGAPKDAREQQFALIITASSLTQLQTRLDALDRVLDDITTQGGGVLRYRSEGASYMTTFRVAAAKRSPVDLAEYERFDRARFSVSLVVDPYGFADPLDIFDDFSFATMTTAGRFNRGGSDWTADAGALTNMAVVGGVVTAAANVTTENHVIHTGNSNLLGDVQVVVKHTLGSTISAYKAGVIHTRLDASNYITSYVDDNGTTSRLRIDKVVAGVVTNLSSVPLSTRLATGTTYWVLGRIEGNVLFAELWTSEPTPMGLPTAAGGATLSTADAALFGAGIRGRVGFVWAPQQSAAALDDFRAAACTYGIRAFPDVLRLGNVPGGTVDAYAAISYTGTNTALVMLYAWWPRLPAHNYVWNGAAEVVGAVTTTAYGWTPAGITSVTNAATSVVRQTAAIYAGTASFEAVTPATGSSGPNFPIYRRGGFRKGVTYTAKARMRSAASTTLMYVLLGNATSSNLSTATALSTAWTPVSVTWTPTADTDLAYVAIVTAAATATTFQFDDVQVYEGTTAPASDLGGFGPGIIPGAAMNTAAASLTGTAWASTGTNAVYLLGTSFFVSGAAGANANMELPILPHLFTPDDYTRDEVDVAIFGRVYADTTQTGLACALSIAPERGTNYGARRYGNFRAAGKTLKLPTAAGFRQYYLGTITLKVDRARPRREWLRLGFTNSGSATNSFALDHIVLVPARSIARSRSGSSASIVPKFIVSAAETTKLIRSDLSGAIIEPGTRAQTPDDGLGGEPLRIPPDGAELLVWPGDVVVDLTDASTASSAKTYAACVQVAIEPRVHLLRQS
ncbi:MAG: hypothetical protein JWM98_1821 [Thermoleophilia bacterium]|nr:hypothetical protein [Thermoleophilia bacterium]